MASPAPARTMGTPSGKKRRKGGQPPGEQPRMNARIPESCMFKFFHRTPRKRYFYIVCKFCWTNHTSNPGSRKPVRFTSHPTTIRTHWKDCSHRASFELGMTPPKTPARASLNDVSTPAPGARAKARKRGYESPSRTQDANQEFGNLQRQLFVADDQNDTPWATANSAYCVGGDGAVAVSTQSEITGLNLFNAGLNPFDSQAVLPGAIAPSREPITTESFPSRVPPKKLKLVGLCRVWDETTKEEFERLLAFFQHSHRLADLFIQYPATKALFEFLCPGISAYLPGRNTLGGRIFRTISDQCKLANSEALVEKVKATRGRVNLVSDVWQNVSKQHLLACQLTLLGVLFTLGVCKVGSRHDGIAVAKDLEKYLKKAKNDGWDVGAVVTDDAGQCRRAREILALRWVQVVFLHCFAHVINNLVKAVINSTFKETSNSAAAVIYALNTSSSKWLQRANDSMVKTYGKHWSLLRMSDTRWNSVQASLASLLRVKTALQQFHTDWSDDPECPEVVSVFGDTTFWERVKAAEWVVRPLSFASYKLQRDQNTLAEVIYCFGWIYRGFLKSNTGRAALVKCVEDRWFDCEQPLFALALFLHPAYFERSRAIRATRLTTVRNLAQFAIYYYRRLLNLEMHPSARDSLSEDFTEWRRDPPTAIPMSEFNCPVAYWCAVDEHWRQEGSPSLLPLLAVTILSIAVNTATCERLFSDLGLIHTAMRGNMNWEKSVNISHIRQFQRDHAKREVESAKKNIKRIVNPTERYSNGTPFNRRPPPSQNTRRPSNNRTTARITGIFIEDYVGDVFDDKLERAYEREIARRRKAGEIIWESDDDFDGEASDEDELDEIDGFDEPIPVQDQQTNDTELPDQNVKNFEQEHHLEGLRAIKVPLATIFRAVDSESD